jgi:hypothetical protein
MEAFLPLVVPFGLAPVLAVMISSLTKIAIVRMAIRDVPPEDRAEVLKATSSLFSGNGPKQKRRRPAGTG